MMFTRSTVSLCASLALGLSLGACGESIKSAANPILEVIPSEVAFDSVAAGGADIQNVLIRNEGTGTLRISGMSISDRAFSFYEQQEYQGGAVTLEPDEGMEFALVFSPEVEGPASGTLVIGSNDFQAGGETRVPLVVLQNGPRPFVNPNPINFGRISAGGHAEINTTITNIGGASLNIYELIIVGASGAFSIPTEALPATDVVLAPDATFDFPVYYDPVADGFDRGVLIVRWNDPASPDGYGDLQVDILANGSEPCLEVSPNNGGTFDFRERPINRTSQEPFTVRNCSDPVNGQPLVISDIALTNDSSEYYALAQLPAFSLELQPGEDYAFIVEFSPEIEDQIEEGTIVFSSNDPYTPEYHLDLHGIGTNNVCPVAQATCTVRGSGAPATSDLFVVPLDYLDCTASGSEDPDGSIAEYIWSVSNAPDGSTEGFSPSGSENPEFFVDLAGRYVLQLEVVDNRGCVSDPAQVTVVSRPDEDIHVQLVWSTPSDGDETDFDGTDLDLHFLHPNGCWAAGIGSNEPFDCYWSNKEPNWGSLASSTDDPSLDIDDTNGAGPENINLNNPENVTYLVAVDYFSDHGFGQSFATVRIYVYGVLVHEARDKAMNDGEWWVVAAITWPGGDVTPLDFLHPDVPPCPNE